MHVTKVKKKSFLRKATVGKTPVLGGKLFSMVREENKKPNIQFLQTFHLSSWFQSLNSWTRALIYPIIIYMTF